jgi:hypothetical protein
MDWLRQYVPPQTKDVDDELSSWLFWVKCCYRRRDFEKNQCAAEWREKSALYAKK